MITPGKNPTEFEVKKIIKSLKCKKCGEKGNISLVTKQSAASNKNPFRATDSSSSRIYHRSTCGWMGNVKRENEIFFKSKEEAELRKYKPCPSCHPEKLRINDKSYTMTLQTHYKLKIDILKPLCNKGLI